MLWRQAPNYLVLATVEGRTVEVGGPGRDVWELLSDAVGIEMLLRSLASRFSTTEDLIRGDVERLLNNLREGSFVERID